LPERTWEVVQNDVEFVEEALKRRTLELGGHKCDLCHKTLEKLGIVNLDVCSRCQKAYYCSAGCQKTAWKASHKQACRKPSKRREGDIMYLKTIPDERPELQGRLVVVLGSTGEDSWNIRLLRMLRCDTIDREA